MKMLTILLATFLASVSIDNDNDCSGAYSAADETYSYAKKAYNSDSWEDAKTYLKKAMSNAEDVMTYADDCTNE